MFNLDYPAATRRIIEDYNRYIKENGKATQTFTPQARWEIDYIKYREWNVDDQNYWLSYRIGKTLLEKYEFSHVFDLQNSNRTKFYKKY